MTGLTDYRQIQQDEHEVTSKARRSMLVDASGNSISASNKLPVEISSDIELGAVEIKNSTDDTRAVVDSDGLNVSVKKSALPSGAATSANQTSGDQKTQLVSSDKVSIGAFNPLIVNTDSVYENDIDTARCTSVGWTGNISDLFKDLYTGLYNDTATNPKVLYLAFYRTRYLNSIGFGCSLANKYFSNVKIEFIGSDGTVRNTYDDSTNSTKYGTKVYSFNPIVCIAIKISFCTTNTDVGLTNLTIRKEMTTSSRISGIKPDTSVGDVGVTYGGALKTAISDDLNNPAYNTPTGDIRVIEPVRLVGAGFEGTAIDANFWTTNATGTSASVTQTGCELILTSGTSSGATAYAYSVRRARYVSGSSMRFRCVGKLGDTGTANNKRRWGLGWGASMPTITDGAWFQLDGTEFSVVTAKGGVETKVTTFNGNLGQYALTASVAICEIYYTNSKVVFVLGGLILHTVSASTASWTNTLNFHAFKDSLNSAVLGASVTMNARTSSIYRMGKMETQPIYYHLQGNAATHTLKLGAGILHKIIYNNTSGTNITVVDNSTGSTPVVGIITTASAALGVWDYYIPFNNGLILITTGNGLDATIVYE